MDFYARHSFLILLILIWVLRNIFATPTYSQPSQNTKSIKVCIQPNPSNPELSLSLIYRKQRLQLPLVDTCIKVSVQDANRIHEIIVQAEGYQTQVLRLRSDTLTQMLRVVLNEKVNQLQEVTVRSGLKKWYKGDTLVLNAGAAVTDPDASGEDLLNNIPEATRFGGQLRIGNHEIQTVLVNGRELFGGELAAILTNLRADMIQTIEVYERVMNGRSVYIMDIKLNPARKRGQYGNLFGAPATINRYLGGLSAKRLTNNGLLTGNFVYSPVNDIYRNLLRIQSDIQVAALYQGPYSLAESVERGQAVSVQFRPRLLDEFDITAGDNQLKNGRIGYTQAKGSRFSVSGWLNWQKVHGNQRITETRQVTLDSLKQLNETTTNQQLTPGNVAVNLQVNWQPDPDNQLQASLNVTQQRSTLWEEVTKANKLLQKEDILTQSTYNRQLDRREDAWQWQSKLLWTHRFRQPARLFSIAGQIHSDYLNRSLTYSNQLSGNDHEPADYQKVNNFSGLNTIEWGIVYAQPFWKRWLLESGYFYSNEIYKLRQDGYLYTPDSMKPLLYLPNLSVQNFRAGSEQSMLRTLLVHRTPHLRLLAGIVGNKQYLNRELPASGIQERSIAWNPYLFVNYRFVSQLQGGFSIKRFQRMPFWSQLTPTVDSTDIYTVSRGNPALKSASILRYEAQVRWVKWAGTELRVNFRRDFIENPIVAATSIDQTTGALSFTYRQLTNADRWEGDLMLILPQIKESLSLFGQSMASVENSWLIVNSSLIPFKTIQQQTLFVARWLFSKNVTAELENEFTFQIQGAYSNALNRVLQNRFQLNSRIVWNRRLQSTGRLLIFMNQFGYTAFTVQRPQLFLQTDIRVGKNWKAHLLVNNPIGSAEQVISFVDASSQSQRRLQQLPPFAMAGFTYNFTVWK